MTDLDFGFTTVKETWRFTLEAELIVEMREAQGTQDSFPKWLRGRVHRVQTVTIIPTMDDVEVVINTEDATYDDLLQTKHQIREFTARWLLNRAGIPGRF